MNESFILTELSTWLAQFEQQQGRKLRVLHIGNIAANGFLNAKFLRRVGVEADVLCHDYYHIMAYPEWEELRIQDDYKKDMLPQFSEQDRRKYQRPRWFVQGPLSLCFAYLKAKNAGDEPLAARLWVALDLLLFQDRSKRSLRHWFSRTLWIEQIKRLFRPLYTALIHAPWIGNSIKKVKRRILPSRNHGGQAIYPEEVQSFVEEVNGRYKKAFPERQFQFTFDDLEPYYHLKMAWTDLFDHYDIVQCYATDPIYGLLFSKKPYVGFEHGTLRVCTSDDNALYALTALAYREAAHVFVTNGDCLEYANKLCMTNFSPMIHPVDVAQHRVRDEVAIAAIRARYQADLLLFCPLRHDWDIKGTDKHLRALPNISKLVSGKVVLVLMNWGADLKKSKALAEILGITDQLVWMPPLCRLSMIEMIQASDLVLDQTILPCFGSTAPQALACGTPVIMSYHPESTAWIMKEPAPLITAITEEEIVEGVKRTLDKEWLAQFKEQAARWIDAYHSPLQAVNQQVAVYRRMTEGTV